jgi:hypothetical protein
VIAVKYVLEVSYYKIDEVQLNLGKVSDYPHIMGTQYDPYYYIEDLILPGFKDLVTTQELFSCLKHLGTSNSV